MLNKRIMTLGALVGATLAGTTHAENEERGLLPPPVIAVEIEFGGFSTTTATPGQLVDVTLTIDNTGFMTSQNTEVQINSTLDIVGPNSVDVGALAGFDSTDVTFQVRMDCSGGVEWVWANLYNGNDHEDNTAIAIAPGAPTPLTLGLAEEFSGPSRVFDIPVFGWDWMVTAIDPGDSNRNISGGNPDCGSHWASSSLVGSTKDFVAVNGHTYPDAAPFVRVNGGISDEPYRVQTVSAVDIGVGEHERSILAFDIVEAYELDVPNPGRYRFTADVDAGIISTTLHYFEWRDSAARPMADIYTNDAGWGGTETFDFYVHDANERPLIVLVNENHNGADLTITLEHVCACEFTADNVINIADLLEYLDQYFDGDDSAELTGDDNVNIADLLQFLDCWFTATTIGCV